MPILMMTGPWGAPPSGDEDDKKGPSGDQGPWGAPRPSGGSKNNGTRRPQQDADMEDMLRQAQDRFRNVFGAGNGGGGNGRGGNRGGAGDMHPARGIALVAFLIIAIWLGTGFYRVDPEENAVIMTFGKLTDTRTAPGLGYHLPYPIQTVEMVNVALDRRMVVGFTDNDNRAATAESLMLTGDENIIDINFVVLWHIGDAGKYLFEIRDPETTVKKVAESAMREVIGQTQIQKALTEGRGTVEQRTREVMQHMLDEYSSGVIINSVQLLKVNPPHEVIDAFDDVQRARTDGERMKNEAETYRNDIVPRARGEAQKTLQDAEAYKQAVIAKAEGEAARFNSVYEAYNQSRDVTEKRMYIDTMESVLKNTRKVVLGDAKTSPLLPYAPLADIVKPSSK